MSRFLSISFLFFCFIQSVDLWAVAKDTVKQISSLKTLEGTEKIFSVMPEKMNTHDTGLSLVRGYDDVFKTASHYLSLGNNFSATAPLYFHPEKQTGFDFGFHQWDAYTFNRKNMLWYKTISPLADFSYTQGERDLQYFNALFSINIKPYWNVTTRYRKMFSTGYYGSQSTDLQNLSLNTWFSAPNRRYMLMAGSAWNWHKQIESGGYKDSLVEAYINRSISTDFPSLLKFSHHEYKEYRYFLKQFLYLGNTENQKIHDTDKTETSLFFPRLYFSYDVSLHQKKYIYSDSLDDVKMYRNNYISFEKSKDSFSVLDLGNEISFGNLNLITQKDSSQNKLLFNTWFRHNYIMAKMPVMRDSGFANYTTGGSIELSTFANLTAKAEYVLAGANGGDYKFLIKPFKNLSYAGKEHTFFTSLLMQAYTPSLTDMRFHSNHFFYDAKFDKTKFTCASIGAYSKQYNYYLSANYYSCTGYIYYNRDGNAAQYAGNLNYFSLNGNYKFAYKGLVWDNSVYYQKVLSGETVLHLPSFSFNSALSYGHLFFKNSLFADVGLSLRYFSFFAAPVYISGVSRFAVQDSVNIGNYPLLGLWLAARIKRFQFYFITEHINQGLTGNRYYASPHYPFYPSTTPVRLGLRWLFYN